MPLRLCGLSTWVKNVSADSTKTGMFMAATYYYASLFSTYGKLSNVFGVSFVLLTHALTSARFGDEALNLFPLVVSQYHLQYWLT